MMKVPARITQRLDNQVIVKMEGCPKLKSRVLDSTGRNIGKLIRIFGPVKSPYGLVAVNTQIEDGNDLFIEYKEV
ncbi:MAG: hypothetical protein M1616_05725 [Candidatus Thermoplasmatota archaeon]|jgi:rRNA processing protein Gar1|nr:hypothetical protein [Candidatus Thermoplasmatota archaeon]